MQTTVVKRKYPNVRYSTRVLAREDLPCLYHSIFNIEHFHFTDRLDLFALVNPGKQVLFIDVGLIDLCGTKPLDYVLQQAKVPWEKADILITHFHDDHDGNLDYCVERGIRSIMHGPACSYSDARRKRFMIMTGTEHMGDYEVLGYLEFLLNKNRHSKRVKDACIEVADGTRLDVGDYHLQVMFTPGHTLEHISLVEPEKKLFFAGDHVVDAAPGLMQFDPDTNLVGRYLDSFLQLKKMSFNTVFMSHHDPLTSSKEINSFMDKIVHTYDKPLARIPDLLAKQAKPLDTYEIATQYYNHLPQGLAGEPALFRIRRIAIMFGYLECLYARGILERKLSTDGRFLYSYAG